MAYIDEKIIPLKMEEKKHQAPMSLKDGYYINGKLEQFTRTELFNQQIQIFLPESFVAMPKTVRELKYPYASRPRIIKTNLEGSINFLFNLLDNQMGLPEKEVANNFCLILAKTNPAIKIDEITTEKTKAGKEISLLEFTSYGMDELLCSFMCFEMFGKEILHPSVNCGRQGSIMRRGGSCRRRMACMNTSMID